MAHLRNKMESYESIILSYLFYNIVREGTEGKTGIIYPKGNAGYVRDDCMYDSKFLKDTCIISQPAHKYLVDHGDCRNLERTAHDDVARQLPRGAHSGPTALRRVSRAARASPPRPRARSERTVEDLCGAIFFVGCVGWVFPFPAGARARRLGPSISARASTASRHLVSRASAAGANAIRERRARPR